MTFDDPKKQDNQDQDQDMREDVGIKGGEAAEETSNEDVVENTDYKSGETEDAEASNE